MRLLAVAVMLGFAVPTAAAADKDEEKAKEAAVALLKAVKAKDLDAIMKMSGAPFIVKEGDAANKVLKEAADVKAWVKDRLAELNDTSKVPTDVETVVPLADVKDQIKDEAERKTVEEVLGKNGYLAVVKADDKTVIIGISIKDGKAKVVGIATH